MDLEEDQNELEMKIENELKEESGNLLNFLKICTINILD